MKLNYSDQKIEIGKESIFLAGPIPRKNEVKNWKEDAIKYLEILKYDGIVYIPEKQNKKVVEGDLDETNWEINAMTNAKKIVFWIPRRFPDMLGLTTNIEFGMTITFKANDIVVNPSLFNVDTREEMKIEKTMQVGDKIIVHTYRQNKNII